MNRKKIMSLLLLFTLVASLIFPTARPMAKEDGKITIVHLNDVHGRVELDEREGALGFARLKTKLDDLRQEGDVILLNAGDTLHGTTLVNIGQGRLMVDLMNELGFDGITPGNHDFNYGYDQLLSLRDRADFPFLGGNILKESNNESDFESYIIKDVDGYKIGIFGLGTGETKFKSHPDNTKGIYFKDPVESAKEIVGELEDKVDFVVALVHLGIEGSMKPTSQDLAREVPGIDLIIDGHSHEMLNNKEGDSLIVQAGSYTKNIGIVELDPKDGSLEARLIPFEDLKDLEEDQEIKDLIEQVKEENKKVLGQVVGKTKSDLDGERGNVRTKETNLGNLIADAMRESTGADVAFANGGGIRASIPAGDVTIEDIVTAFPFSNTLAVIEVSGSELRQALELGISKYPEENGAFPQISGLSYSFDPSKPVGSRLQGVLVGDKALDEKASYKLVTNDFLAAGGDGYTMFENKRFIGEGGLLSDVLIDYFKLKGEVSPSLEGRIKEARPQIEDLDSDKPKEEKKTQTIYRVKSGDVLWKIARKFNVDWKDLAKMNNLKNPHLIYPNQELIVIN